MEASCISSVVNSGRPSRRVWFGRQTLCVKPCQLTNAAGLTAWYLFPSNKKDLASDNATSCANFASIGLFFVVWSAHSVMQQVTARLRSTWNAPIVGHITQWHAEISIYHSRSYCPTSWQQFHPCNCITKGIAQLPAIRPKGSSTFNFRFEEPGLSTSEKSGVSYPSPS